MWVWVAIICIIICLILVFICYIWLYILAQRQENRLKKLKEAQKQIAQMLGAIIDSPTSTSRADEISALNDYIKDDKKRRMDILSTLLIEVMLNSTEEDERGKQAVYQVYNVIRPDLYYSDMLHNGTVHEKAFACKMLSSFFQSDEIPEIRKCLKSRNKELVYNASIALSVLGDEDGLSSFILSCKNNYEYSHRIILELFSVYSGNIRTLAEKVLQKCDDYIKATIIKAIAKYKITEFENLYLQCAKSKDPNLRAASIKALCEIGKPEYEQLLIISTHDSMWYIRSAAVKGLGKLNTPSSRQALLEAVKDKEWWVRYNAAHTLVEMDGGLDLAEKVLSGYDRFAADAVKFALYKTYDV